MSTAVPTTHQPGMGLIPQSHYPDHPDAQRPALPMDTVIGIPEYLDFRTVVDIPVQDQDGVNCCTAGAVSGLVAFERAMQGEAYFPPSMLFNYAYSRKRLGITGDNGSTLSAALASAVNEGICSEGVPAAAGRWEFDPALVAVMPNDAAVFAAKHHRASWHWSVPNTTDGIFQALVRHHPVCFGMAVYGGFMAPGLGGLIPEPGGTFIGNHGVTFWGYDLRPGSPTYQHFLLRNQWGLGWADNGYGWLPMDYPVYDCWVIARESA